MTFKTLKPLYGSQPCHGEGVCILNETMNHAVQDHLRQTGHSEEFGQTMVHLRRKWQPTAVFLPWEPMNSMKKQKDMTLDEPPRLQGI